MGLGCFDELKNLLTLRLFNGLKDEISLFSFAEGWSLVAMGLVFMRLFFERFVAVGLQRMSESSVTSSVVVFVLVLLSVRLLVFVLVRGNFRVKLNS